MSREQILNRAAALINGDRAKDYGDAATSFADEVDTVLADVGRMLIAKNQAYGDAALNPMRVFSSADTGEQLRVRLDDKISRLARGEAAGEDQIADMLGYLVLLTIHEKRAK